MTEPVSGIDFANLPAPNEGILVALFITVRKVARSRDFYSRVLGGTVVGRQPLRIKGLCTLLVAPCRRSSFA